MMQVLMKVVEILSQFKCFAAVKMKVRHLYNSSVLLFTVSVLVFTGRIIAAIVLAIAEVCSCLCACVHVCVSLTPCDPIKTTQARIMESSPSALQKTLLSGSVRVFYRFERGHID